MQKTLQTFNQIQEKLAFYCSPTPSSVFVFLVFVFAIYFAKIQTNEIQIQQIYAISNPNRKKTRCFIALQALSLVSYCRRSIKSILTQVSDSSFDFSIMNCCVRVSCICIFVFVFVFLVLVFVYLVLVIVYIVFVFVFLVFVFVFLVFVFVQKILQTFNQILSCPAQSGL